MILSTIVIEGNGHTIIRNSSSGSYRFFSIGADGHLTLKQLPVAGGGGVNKGGAILVYGDGGNASLSVLNSTLRNNTALNDGGAIQIASVQDYVTSVSIVDSALYGNGGGPDNKAEGEGGAVYSTAVRAATFT